MLKMSFSKAKLKRFNDVQVGSSPFAEPKEKEKETKKSKKEEKIKQGSLDAESIKTTKSAFDLFRTPSLPRRLKFRHISDLTPKKLSKDAKKCDKESSQPSSTTSSTEKLNIPPIVQLYNKIDVNKEALQKSRTENEELKSKIAELNAKILSIDAEKMKSLTNKENEIMLLERELTSISKADELLQRVAEGCLVKVKENEEEIRSIHKKYEEQLTEVYNSKIELEIKYEELVTVHRILQDDYLILEGENLFLSEEATALREIVEAHDMELQKKIEEIKTLELGLNELAKQSSELKEQVNFFRSQSQEDMLRYVDESRMTIQEIDSLKKDLIRLTMQMAERDQLLQDLQEELKEKEFESDEIREELRNAFNMDIATMIKKYEQQITTMKEANDMKVKELESIFVLEKSKLIKEQIDKIRQIESDHSLEIERIGETAEEKIKISEVQNEEKVKALEASIQSAVCTAVAAEQALWKNELDKCQKIAESEIMQCEFEKRDLKALWEASNELIKEYENKIATLEHRLLTEISGTGKSKDEYECELKEVKMECARLKTEKYNYQLTLNNTRSTVNILMERLKKSDTDVEILKVELDSVLKSKAEIEAENAKVKEDLEEYKSVLKALKESCLNLEKEVQLKEEIFEKMISSEEDAIMKVSQMGKLFNDNIEKNISKYFETHSDLKQKYEARESYIRELKALLDEFGTGIELARLELDSKDKRIFELENENKDIKLETMTYRFKCEQFEKYQNEIESKVQETAEEDEKLVTNFVIENIINQLEKETIVNCDSNEKKELQEKLKETEEKLQVVEHFAKETSEKYKELLDAQNNKQKTNKDTPQQLKIKISKLQEINKKQENTILGLQEQLTILDSPKKMNSPARMFASPKTPKGLMSPYPGKENRSSPAAVNLFSPRNALKPRN